MEDCNWETIFTDIIGPSSKLVIGQQNNRNGEKQNKGYYLRATYDDHLRLIRKRVVDFLLVLIELFSLGVKAEALRVNIGSKSAISLQRGPVDPKFQVPPPTIFLLRKLG